MLSKHGWRLMNSRGRTAHVDGVADQFHLTHLRVLNFHRKSVLPNLWIGENFIKRIDRRGGNILFEQTAQPLLPAATAKDRLQLLDQNVVVRNPPFAIIEPLV